MKSPFRSLLKETARARRTALSGLSALQKLTFSGKAKPRPRSTPGKPVVRQAKSRRRPPAEVRPPPDTFTAGRFISAQGSLDYWLYTPAGSARRRLPLVVMLHGCTQTSSQFASATRMNDIADELGFLVLYPQQSRSANFARCWNWHRPGDQKRGGGEPAAIAALTRHIIALCKGRPDRVYIAGISAGGAAAAIIGAAYPDIYVAVGVHSGLAKGDVTTLSGALAAMRNGHAMGPKAKRSPAPLPTIVFHGDQDRVVHPSNADAFLRVLRASRNAPLLSRTETGRSTQGRSFTRTVHGHSSTDSILEEWTVHGGSHGWSGGRAGGSYTDPGGPDASREMARFFLARRRKSGSVSA